jgi:hypothetical protein
MVSLPRSAILLLLLTAATAQQVRYVATATLPAQDVVDVVSVAQRVQREGLAETMRAEPVPPLFPALVAGTHSLLRRTGIIDKHNWITPPQCVAAAALILAVIPIFLTAERIAGRGPAVIAAIFFITLPAVARLGGDGLGDAVHLCLVAWSVWFIALSSGGNEAGRLAGNYLTWSLAGLGIAAALLVRAEAIVVPLAIFLLAVWQREYRRPLFFAMASLCVVPYLAVDVTSSEEIVERLRGGAAPTESVPFNPRMVTLHCGGGAEVALLDESRHALTFGHKDRTRSSRFHGLAATIGEFIDEGLMASGYILPFLTVAGFALRRRSEREPYDVFVLIAVGLQLAVIFAVAWRNGYLSTRHFALPVMLTLPYVGLGLTAAKNLKMPSLRFQITGDKFPAVIVGLFVLVSLIATRRPLHESNLAHREAAEWLKTTAVYGDVLDQQGYTALTSGRTTYRFDAAETALGSWYLKHVIVERGDLEAESPRGESLRKVLGNSDSPAATFTAPRGKTERDVLVFTRHLWGFDHRELSDAR